MKRFTDFHLKAWKNDALRLPLIIRGARQVGKTYSVREFGKNFSSFVEINFELLPQAGEVFARDLVPSRIIRDLSLVVGKTIEPGKTLLFFDEVQHAPRSIASLRYFHEMMPELHVIAAGSLIEFVLDAIGVPVGRIANLYMYPCSFLEFLAACGHRMLIEAILSADNDHPLSEPVHEKLIALIGEYMAVGGMPGVVDLWARTQDIRECGKILGAIAEAYRQDFQKYATKYERKYVDLLFDAIPAHLGHKIKFSVLQPSLRKKELESALDLLAKAGIVHKVLHTAAHGVPLGASVDPDKFKAVFLDCALAQVVLGIDLGSWILQPRPTIINKGEIVESFVGQELLALQSPHSKKQLYYWHREARSSNAEVDYVMQKDRNIVPIEVKSGKEGRLKSMRLFLEEHKNSLYGLRFSPDNFSHYDSIDTVPLYAIAGAIGADREVLVSIM
jgi:hypothetical protein